MDFDMEVKIIIVIYTLIKNKPYIGISIQTVEIIIL